MQVEHADEIAIVRLKGGKANAMDYGFLEALIEVCEQVEAMDVRAVVMTGYDRYFSAGLALPALIDLDRHEMRKFIDFFGTAMLKVFQCHRPVVAAINGHAIAGGCVLALMADVRLMTDAPAKIGLNEVQLGIGLPAVVTEPLKLAVPAASLVPIAMMGGLFAPADALKLGLVDAVVPAADLEKTAWARAKALAQAPAAGVAQVKTALRRGALDAIAARSEDERERWLDCWFGEPTQAVLRAAAAKLGGGKTA